MIDHSLHAPSRSERDAKPMGAHRSDRPDATFGAGLAVAVADNQQIQAQLRCGAVQAKLAISPPDDPLERKADEVAETLVQRKEACSCGGTCEECQQREQIQLKRNATHAHRDAQMSASPRLMSRLGSGRGLDPTTRGFFEANLNHDFGRTRIHTDAAAAESAASINARAYTAGSDVVFAHNEFQPHTTEGTKLLAHELTHVKQNADGDVTAVKRQQLDDEESSLVVGSSVQIRGSYQSEGGQVEEGETVIVVSPPHDGMVQVQYPIPHLRAGETLEIPVGLVQSTGAPEVQAAPPTVEFSLTPPPGVTESPMEGFDGPIVYVLVEGEQGSTGSSFGLRGAVPGLTMGIGRGIGFVDLPPIRGGIQPRFGSVLGSALEPAWMRGRGAGGLLGDLPGGGIGLERYVDDAILKQLRPRYHGPEGQLLAELEYLRRTSPGLIPPGSEKVARWADVADVSHSQLGEIDDLLRRAASEGLETLDDAQRALLMTVVEAHAQGNLVAGSPLLSGTTREGLSLLDDIPGTIGKRPYIVEIELPSGASVGDVNDLLGDRRMVTLLQESEQVFETASGARIRMIRVNPTSALARTMSIARHAGPIAEIAGLGYSGYRIGSATEQERPRVIGEEAGGQVGGYLGSAGGVALCIFFGIATGGWGLLACAIVGGVAGGVGGSIVGGEIGEAARHSGSGSGSGSSYVQEQLQGVSVCFTPSTTIQLADGTQRPIVDICVNDRVLAFDEQHGRIVPARVRATHRHAPDDFLKLTCAGGTSLNVTPNHPLFVDGTWRPAGDVTVGDRLETLDACSDALHTQRVVDVCPQSAGPMVHNLSIDVHRTYFADGVLVHNK